jgi:hypothetical protein
MSTHAPQPQSAVVMVPTLPPPRHAFGWPPGSIRAILVLIVVALVCALMLITRTQKGDIIPIPPYLLYLLFMAVGYYFAARGHTHPAQKGVPPPLWLPAGSIRLLIMAALTATVVWKLVNDREGLIEQLTLSADMIKKQPLLPLVLLGGFFLGVVVRLVIIGKHERSPWAQDLEAWVSLVGVLLMGVSALIHLVINPTLESPLHLPDYEGFLGAVVTLYFGLRT